MCAKIKGFRGEFEVETNSRGLLKELRNRWMDKDLIEPFIADEEIAVALDDRLYLGDKLVEEFPEAAFHLKSGPKQEKAKHNFFKEVKGFYEHACKSAKNPTILRLPKPEVFENDKALTLSYAIGKLEIKRVVTEHPLHPIPIVRFEVSSKSSKQHIFSIFWGLRAKTPYALLPEIMGPVDEEFMKELGNRLYFYIHRIPRRLARKHSYIGNLSLEFGRIEPHSHSSFEIDLWFSRSLYDTLGFSGLAFIADPEDWHATVAAIATSVNRSAIWYSVPLHRHFTPVFWTKNGRVPHDLINFLRNTPVKAVVVLTKLTPSDMSELEKIGIKVLRVDSYHGDIFLDIQRSINDYLKLSHSPSRVLVVSDDFPTALVNACYAPRQGIQLMIRSEKTSDLLKQLKPSRIMLYGNKNELQGLRKELESNQFTVDLSSEEYYRNCFRVTAAITNHHTLARLILRKRIDPEDTELDSFCENSGIPCNIDSLQRASEEQVILYANPRLNGPPMTVLSTFSMKGGKPRYWQNAAVGAFYASAKSALFLLASDPSERSKRLIRRHLQTIDLSDWISESQESLLELSRTILLALPKEYRLLLGIGEFVGRGRGTRALLIFPSDAAVPYELICYKDRFGKINTLGSSFALGRLIGETYHDTTFLAALTIRHSLISRKTLEYVVIASPTKDLFGPIQEAENLRYLMKEKIDFPIKLFSCSIDDVHLLKYESLLRMRGRGKYEEACAKVRQIVSAWFADGCVLATKGNLLTELPEADVIHFSGHGDIDKEPYLVLQGSETLFGRDIPYLKKNPLVFVNACLSGSTRTSIKKRMLYNTGLSTTFIRKGALAFIGALWSVHDLISSLMMEFHTRAQFLPIGLALAITKQQAFRLMGSANPSSSAFVLYGDPTTAFFETVGKSGEALYYGELAAESWRGLWDAEASKEYSSRFLSASRQALEEFEDRSRRDNRRKSLWLDQQHEAKLDILFAQGCMHRSNAVIYAIQLDRAGSVPVSNDIVNEWRLASSLFLQAAKMASQDHMRTFYSAYGSSLRGIAEQDQGTLCFLREEYVKARRNFKSANEWLYRGGKLFHKLWEFRDHQEITSRILACAAWHCWIWARTKKDKNFLKRAIEIFYEAAEESPRKEMKNENVKGSLAYWAKMALEELGRLEN